MLRAREGIQYSRGEDRNIEALKTKFESFCPTQTISYEQNPFFTCVERAGGLPSSRRSCFHPVACWFVNRIKQALLDGFQHTKTENGENI